MDNQTDVQELIARITSSERVRSSAHFSDALYRDEPILTTGRQMARYLPDKYREMRAISRWQDGSPHGRWLTEAELFYRQGMFMADFEDDCPYHGTFKAYYPTYSAMSDRQLRGYFTWRTAVRRGDIQDTSLSFVYVYLYELLCGIGVRDSLDGFERLHGFWQAYRKFEPKVDRYVRVWLRDYVVYHGLDPSLLDEDPVIPFDQALFRLVKLSASFDPPVLESIGAHAPRSTRAKDGSENAAVAGSAYDAEAFAPSASTKHPGKRGAASALPLPPDTAREDALLQAIDALSTYRIRLSRLYKDYPDDVRHVACAVYVRLLEYYRRHRSHGLIESMFGEQANMLYTMFASAIFFDPQQHAPCDFELDPIHWYRCREGQWRCIRVYGTRGKSSKLGTIMRAIDGTLREALDFPHPLKEQEVPKYLKSMIDREITAWLTWKAAHAPRRIDIDLSQLSSIRSAADEVREALLTDEERGDAPVPVSVPDSAPVPGSSSAPTPPFAATVGGMGLAGSTVGADDVAASRDAADAREPFDVGKPVAVSAPLADMPPGDAPTEVAEAGDAANATDSHTASRTMSAPGGIDIPDEDTDFGGFEAFEEQGDTFPGVAGAGSVAGTGNTNIPALSDAARAYLAGLLSGVPQVPAGTTEDMLVDAINEAFFDLVGDTVIEFSAEGPRIIEDYEDDIREVLAS